MGCPATIGIIPTCNVIYILYYYYIYFAHTNHAYLIHTHIYTRTHIHTHTHTHTHIYIYIYIYTSVCVLLPPSLNITTLINKMALCDRKWRLHLLFYKYANAINTISYYVYYVNPLYDFYCDMVKPILTVSLSYLLHRFKRIYFDITKFSLLPTAFLRKPMIPGRRNPVIT